MWQPFIILSRRKRQYSSHNLVELLEEMGVSTNSLMPLSDAASRQLNNMGGCKNGRQQSSPMFPTFLPLEVFDDTEFDCRTPEEWVSLGEID